MNYFDQNDAQLDWPITTKQVSISNSDSWIKNVRSWVRDGMYDNLLSIASFFLSSHGKVKILGYFHFPRFSLENENNAWENWNSLCTDAPFPSERLFLGEGRLYTG